MSDVNLTINGIPVRIPAGSTLLQAAESISIRIPTLCYHPDLSLPGSCRVCVVHVKDILAVSLTGKPIDLQSLVRLPLYVPTSMHALNVLEQFKQKGVHIALAVDEYGVVQGLMTLNDIMEAVVGEIPAEDEPKHSGIVRRDDGSWLLDGMLTLDQVKEQLEVDRLPGEDQLNFQTLGGLMMSQLGHIPLPADHFEWRNWRFVVVDMDGKRVDKVLVAPKSAERK